MKDLLAPEKPASKSFEELSTLAREHPKPASSLHMARHRFYNYRRCQELGSSSDAAVGDASAKFTGRRLVRTPLAEQKAKGSTLFDSDYFSWNPKPFFCLAKSRYPGNYRPNSMHYFLRLLHERGLLLRLYTQNIDGLERAAGIPAEKLVEAHGTVRTASCSLCNSPHLGHQFKVAILNDEIPRCETCSGIVKPDIVFFGERLPKNFDYYREDFKRSDFLIVMGTSLEIEPFASIVNCVRPRVPRLLLNRDPVGPFKQTHLKPTELRRLGDLSGSVQVLVKLLGWESDLEQLIKRESGCPLMNSTDPRSIIPGNPEINAQPHGTGPSAYPHKSVASKFNKCFFQVVFNMEEQIHLTEDGNQQISSPMLDLKLRDFMGS
uniref:NAD-dependent protein deacetylase sirtuin-3 n=1 Tax=Pristiophorus japonicus TaxID=55135 RepID=UPI00398E63CA